MAAQITRKTSLMKFTVQFLESATGSHVVQKGRVHTKPTHCKSSPFLAFLASYSSFDYKS